jgi:hypothetical protein
MNKQSVLICLSVIGVFCTMASACLCPPCPPCYSFSGYPNCQCSWNCGSGHCCSSPYPGHCCASGVNCCGGGCCDTSYCESQCINDECKQCGGSTTKQCCDGKGCYEPTEKHCCNFGTGKICNNDQSCCKGKNGEACCDNPTEGCCEGQCYDSVTKGCCDGTIYDLETQKCCGDRVCLKDKDCCGSICCDPELCERCFYNLNNEMVCEVCGDDPSYICCPRIPGITPEPYCTKKCKITDGEDCDKLSTPMEGCAMNDTDCSYQSDARIYEGGDEKICNPTGCPGDCHNDTKVCYTDYPYVKSVVPYLCEECSGWEPPADPGMPPTPCWPFCCISTFPIPSKCYPCIFDFDHPDPHMVQNNSCNE